MRTTVNLEEEVLALVKARAEATGRSLGDVLSELVKRGLEPQLPAKKTKGQFPTFSVSKAAPTIPGFKANELLAEEGSD